MRHDFPAVCSEQLKAMTQDVSAPRGERNGRNDSIGLLAAGCLLVWFLASNQQLLPSIVVPAAVSAVFAFAGWLSRGVSSSGAMAGWVIAILIYAAGGIGLFVVLFAVFALTWIATRIGRSRKESLGLAEPKHGRGAMQVMANLSVGAICASLAISSGNVYLLGACVAALCEAAADTTSSEIGQTFARTPRLVSTLEPVPPGTNGAVSIAGTASGIASAVVVMTVAWGAIPLSMQVLWPSAACGILGMFVDSLLGATLERRGYLNNDAVNFLGTASAAGLALLLTTTY